MKKVPISKNQCNQKKSGGFTLVETLIAIAILMIAIAGPLTVANNALRTALGSRNVMIATYLAQDGIESIKNIKDNNVAAHETDQSVNWLDGLYDTGCSSSSHPCIIPKAQTYPPVLSNSPYTCSSDDGFSACKLRTDDTLDYYYPSFEVPDDVGLTQYTPFIRYYFMTVGANTNERIVTVVVSWMEGSIPNEIRLQELITNTPR